MLFRLSRALVVASLLAGTAFAAPKEARNGGGGTSQCNTTGSPWCCNSVESLNAAGLGVILALLGVVLPADVTGLVGFGCLSVVDVPNCSQQAVCCENVQQNGLVNFGCTPISL
ncbi:hypothetical protein B0H10DRAFT_1280710 [Mycena sp. CBHHK59/15]|nr:hypothetical protein B0H10DRAFT_1280710 [Mycena sp. CBHHK59/15]